MNETISYLLKQHKKYRESEKGRKILCITVYEHNKHGHRHVLRERPLSVHQPFLLPPRGIWKSSFLGRFSSLSGILYENGLSPLLLFFGFCFPFFFSVSLSLSLPLWFNISLCPVSARGEKGVMLAQVLDCQNTHLHCIYM